MMSVGTVCADIVVGVVRISLWLGEHPGLTVLAALGAFTVTAAAIGLAFGLAGAQ
jgi:hypothetical protein